MLQIVYVLASLCAAYVCVCVQVFINCMVV